MTRRFLSVLVVASVVLRASVALADSDDLSVTGPMAFLHPPGDRVYALTSAGNVVYRQGSTREWTPVGPPPDGAHLYLSTGLAAAEPTNGWYRRVFAIAQPTGPNPARIWELKEGDDSWRSLTPTPYGSLEDSAIAAVANPDNITIAVRAKAGSVWTCHIYTSTGDCQWQNDSLTGPVASLTSPIEAFHNPYTGLMDQFKPTSVQRKTAGCHRISKRAATGSARRSWGPSRTTAMTPS